MVESVNSLVAQAKKSKYSLVSHLSEDDILAVWDSLSDFLERQMLQVKGVCIHGFGTFTFSMRKVDISGSKITLIQRPVFVMAESFIQTHSLTYPRQYTTNHIPVVPLNYTVLCNGTSYDRDTVELSVREVLHAIAKALASNKSVNVDFPKIGRLLIREKKAHMKFFKEFVRSMESSGNPQVAFHLSTYHTGSESSIMSEPNYIKSFKSYTPQLLPKITETAEDRVSTANCADSTNSSSGSCLKNSPQPLQKCAERPGTPYHSPRPATVVPLSVVPTSNTSSNQISNSSGTSTARDNQASACIHNNGQNMCYICHQRELRNIPISLAEETKKRELLQDKLLQKFQERNNSLFTAQEKAKQLKNKEIAKEIANFNLDVTERKRRERQNRPKTFDYDPNLFNYRSITPCYTKKQLEYCYQLDQQVKRRREALKLLKQAEEEREKQEQMELAKEEAFVTKMAQKKASYQQALDEQIHSKDDKCKSPSFVAQPVFCVQDNTPMQTHDKCEKSRLLLQEQLVALSERQKALKVRQITERDNDALTLRENLEDLKYDLNVFKEEQHNARKELEESWQSAIRRKQLNELSEKLTEQANSILLHDQCKKYLRCHQCQRKLANLGKSNILSESRYVAGSRLIV